MPVARGGTRQRRACRAHSALPQHKMSRKALLPLPEEGGPATGVGPVRHVVPRQDEDSEDTD